MPRSERGVNGASRPSRGCGIIPAPFVLWRSEAAAVMHLRKCPRAGPGITRRRSESPHDEKRNRSPIARPWWPAGFRGHRAKPAFRTGGASGHTRRRGQWQLLQLGAAAGFQPDRCARQGAGAAAVWTQRGLCPAAGASAPANQPAHGGGHGGGRHHRRCRGLQHGSWHRAPGRCGGRTCVGCDWRRAGGTYRQRRAHHENSASWTRWAGLPATSTLLSASTTAWAGCTAASRRTGCERRQDLAGRSRGGEEPIEVGLAG